MPKSLSTLCFCLCVACLMPGRYGSEMFLTVLCALGKKIISGCVGAIHSALKLGSEMVSDSVVRFSIPYKLGLKSCSLASTVTMSYKFSFIFMVAC